jgi:hypothetical protein
VNKGEVIGYYGAAIKLEAAIENAIGKLPITDLTLTIFDDESIVGDTSELTLYHSGTDSK